nr:glucose-6-phosphate dehydrogenase [Conchiformibius kuhniae]
MLPRPDFDLLLFGASGDLALRKLFPALYRAHAHGLLHPDARIIGIGRSAGNDHSFRQRLNETLAREDGHAWDAFLRRVHYISADLSQTDAFSALAQTVRPDVQPIAYLSTAPDLFVPVCRGLAQAGLSRARVVLEKPLGHDLASSRHINAEVGRYFPEAQIYRIDHYLGKPALQSLLPLRFDNLFFEPVWHSGCVRSVQITVAETLGVGTRGAFYDRTGALRDMVQNHLLQMLCFTAMERPASSDADAVRDAKLAFLNSLRIYRHEADIYAVRGQYAGYTAEPSVAPDSRTETFAAVQVVSDSPRWAGVPFYLRSGKCMAQKLAQIVVDFKPAAALFGQSANRLTVSLQPDETVSLRVAAGGGQTGEMVLDLAAQSPERRMEAYETLLLEVIGGRLALFNRRDELEAAWAWATPILARWQEPSAPAPQIYPVGSWGAAAADALTARNGDVWLPF